MTARCSPDPDEVSWPTSPWPRWTKTTRPSLRVELPEDVEVRNREEHLRHRGGKTIVETTPGRASIFNDILPDGMPFYNYELSTRVHPVANHLRRPRASRPRVPRSRLLDSLKSIGFKGATYAGRACRSARTTCSCLRHKDDIITKTQAEVDEIETRQRARHHHRG